MNTRNGLVEKLLKVAKKNKILTYPVLALVAVASVFNYFFSWSKGAGKRVIAMVMVLVMLVSQSYFLTSSATALVDDENAAKVQKEIQEKLIEEETNKVVENATEQTDKTTEITTELEQTGEIAATTEEQAGVVSTESDADGLVTDEERVTTDDKKTDTEDDSDVLEEDTDSKLAAGYVNCVFRYLRGSGSGSWGSIPNDKEIEQNPSGEYDLSTLSNTVLNMLNTGPDYTESGCYIFEGWYTDPACKDSQKVNDLTKVKATNNQIILYSKRALAKYRVQINTNAENPDGGQDVVTFDTDATKEGDYYYVDIADNTFNISNISRTGYTMGRATAIGGTAVTNVDDHSVTVTFTGNSLDKVITLNWVANKYKIRYASNDSLDSPIADEQTVQYNGTETIKETNIAEPKEGYAVLGWKIGDPVSGQQVDAGSNVRLVQNLLYQYPQEEADIVVLYPNYDYAGVELALTEEEKVLQFVYNEEKNYYVQGRYIGSSKAGSDNFTYSVSAADNIKNTYGIEVLVEDGGVWFRGTPTNIAPDGMQVGIDITDNNAPGGPQTTTHYVTIQIAKKIVKIKPPANNSHIKTYDGTNETSAEFPNELNTEVQGVTVRFDSAHYNSANVKDANRIILENVQVFEDGNPTNHYVVQLIDGDYYVEGSITPRKVLFRTYVDWSNSATNKRQYLRTGEKDELLKFVLEEVKDDTGNTGFLDGDSIQNVEPIQFMTGRDDLMVPGTYEITAKTAEVVNYEIIIHWEDVGTFEVVAEDPIEGEHFEIKGTLGNNEWYFQTPPQAVIKKGIDYNMMRVSTDGENPSGTASAAVNLDDGEYSDKDKIWIQLYDTKTGAVSRWKRLYIKVDTKAPEYDSFVLTQDQDTLYNSTGEGFYFPSKGMVSFGNYFNNTVSITIKFKDVTSGLTTLHYGLYGESVTKRSVLFEPTDDEYAVATFELYKGAVEKAGTIEFCAEDKAGNKSAPKKLSRDGADDWSVETGGPAIEQFFVRGGENGETIANGSSEYYANCEAVLSVKDTVSGVNSVAWNVNGVQLEAERVTDTKKKQGIWIFVKPIDNDKLPNEDGIYSLYAVVTDNAGNTSISDTIQFRADSEPPVINITSMNDKWEATARVEFDTYDLLSGIKSIKVKDEEGNLVSHNAREEKGRYYCYFETSTKGKYSIIVSDKAGNTATKEINLDKVSDQHPDCPQITVTPENADGNDGWYRQIPSFAISNVTQTEDGTQAFTKYQLWKEGEAAGSAVSISSTVPSILEEVPGEGIYNLKVWSESIAGQECEGRHQYQFKVDTVSPSVKFSTTKGNGSTILVNFTVTDNGSGVDAKTIRVLHGTTDITAKAEEIENGYAGSFEVSQTGDYFIQAADYAGNVSDVAAFRPMSMKIKAVTNITNSSATLRANVIKGTFDISSVALAYRKASDTTYTEADALVTKDTSGNAALSAVLGNLQEGTAYIYKVTAVSSANEVLEYEGSFRTRAAGETGISVSGIARYADNRSGAVTVGIFDGNICIMAQDVNAGDEFVFENVPDGNYSIVATDGIFSKTVRLLIKDGMVVYPNSYIEMILSGQNTSVIITTDETPHVTADNMDSIFDDDNINFTDSDKALIEDGGIVEFQLHATLMRVSSVSANEISAMYAVTDKNKIVGAYLDLSLYKVVTDMNGETKRTRVTNLANGASVSVTIPLGDLAGKQDLEIVRIHNDGENFVGASLVDQDSNPNTYTISSNQFSTYAVLYRRGADVETPPDGDGGTNNEDDKKPGDTTEKPNDQDNKKPGDTTEKPNDDPVDDPGDDGPDDKQQKGASVGSLKSSGSAKTGDGTPIAAVGSLMLLSMGGFFFFRKKINKFIEQ